MRFPKLTRAELTPEQAELYDAIVGGPRASGPFPLQDADGSLTGPFGVMLHAPGVGGPLQELGAAVRYRTVLSDRVREIAILSVAAATGCAFERHAHEPIGRAAGLTEAELAALADGSFTSDDPVESAAHALGERPLTEQEYRTLGAQRVVELVVLFGYYRTLAQLMDCFEVTPS